MTRQKIRGSVLLLALLLIAVAGLLTAGWIALISARGNLVEQNAAAIQRRIALENSRALAQEFMLERVLPSTAGAAFSYDLPDPGWGGLSIPAWNSAPLLSVQPAAGVNHFNPGNGDGYTFDPVDESGHYVTLRDGDANPERKFQIKSRSPLLSGTLLASQRPTLDPSASTGFSGLDVVGAAFLWTYPTAASFTVSSYSTADGVSNLSLTNSAGSDISLNNLALPRQIANPRGGGAAFYDGQLDALDNSTAGANSSFAKAAVAAVNGSLVDPDDSDGITCDGAGNVTVTLNKPGLGNVLITAGWPNPGDPPIPGGVSTLTLIGQPTVGDAVADDLPAILILVDITSGNLPTISLSQHNSRRLVLGVKKAATAGSLSLRFTTTAATWRLMLELENSPATLTTAGIVTLQGGIRSDRAVAISGGSARLTLETDPKNLSRLATRTAWVESYEIITPP
jgi:hypothetical protein